MKGTCPIQTNLDWLSVKDVVGSDNTWKIWMASKEGILPEPVKAAFYLYVEQDPVGATELLDKYIPFQTKAGFDFTTPVLDMIEGAQDEMFTQDSFKQFLADKGYSEKIFQGEKIKRTPEVEEQVTKKEQTIIELAAESPDASDFIGNLDPVELHNKIKAEQIILDYVKKFSNKYTTITTKEAQTLLTGSATPYNGETVFWHYGTNYFISDKINVHTNFHEISLPIIQSVRKINKPLYDKIVERLSNTPMGQQIVNTIKANNPTLNEKSEVFTDKLLVSVLKQDAINKSVNKGKLTNADPVTLEFNKVVGDLMSMVRPALRTTFSVPKSMPLTKLDTNSSLISMARTLLEAHAEAEELTPKEMIEANSELEKAVDDILNAVKTDETKKEIDNIINNTIEVANKQILETKSKPYWEIKKELSDEESGGYLRDIADRLRDFGKNISPEKAKTIEKLDLSFKARALVQSLFTLEKALTKINEHMAKLESSGKTTEEILEKVQYYNHLLKDWSQFISETEDHLIKAGIKRDTSLYRFVSALNGSVNEGLINYMNIQQKGSVEFTTSLLNDAAKPILDNIDSEITRLKSKPGDKSYIDRFVKDLEAKKEKFTFDKDKVNRMYRGELGDSNFFSSMFESYTSNPDPILASFALFLKQNLSKITNNYLEKSRTFMDEIRPMMKKLGMNSDDVKKMWGEYISPDTKPISDANGKVTPQAVLSFLSPVGNGYRVKMAELEQAIDEAKESGDKEAIKAAYVAKEAELQARFNREFKPEYYASRKELIENSPDAYEALEDVNRRIREMDNQFAGDIDMFENNDSLTALYDEKKRLYSEYNEDGTPKEEKDRKIAQALNENRKKTGKFYKSIEKPGAFQRSFEGFINAALSDPTYQHITKENTDGSFTPEFSDIINKWLKQNIVKRYTQEYYNQFAAIMQQLESISKNIPAEYNVAELFKKKTQLLNLFKDEDGSVDPAKMKGNRDKILAEIKDIQKQMNDIQENAKNDRLRVSAEVKQQLSIALKLLSQLRYKEPTKYYLDEINEYMSFMNEPALDEETAQDFLRDTLLIEKLRGKYPSFKEWFKNNHISKGYMSRDGDINYNYHRLDAWSQARPIEDEDSKGKYISTTTVTYNGQEFKIEGVPGKKYSFVTIKDEYRTIPRGLTQEERAKYIGTVVDNRGQYLPLSREQYAEQGRPVDETYINQEYYKLIENKDKKELLDTIHKFHLQNQGGLDRNQKLYLDVPRFAMHENLEKIKAGRLTKRWVDKLKSISKGIQSTVRGLSREEINKSSEQDIDEVGEFSNPDVEKEYEKFTMIKDGYLDPVLDKIPIKGLNNIPIEDVSYDVLSSLNLYGMQAEKQRVLNEISPVAQAMLNTLENIDKGTEQLGKIRDKQSLSNKVLSLFTGEKGTATRTAAFRSLYNREFKGQLYSDRHLDWVNKVTSALTTGASINYFALNLPSGIKNYWGMLWQNNLEALAGEYLDFKSLGKGKVRSKTALHEWSTRVWGGNYNTLDTQIILHFDPIQGKAEESLGKDASRTFTKDLASLSWVYSPRKYMEMEGGLQLFYSMMYHKKLERNLNGQKSLISYADAFELKDNKMSLKDGIDKSYDIGGAKFHKFQNAVHEKFKDLNGAFAKFEQPQAQAYFAYRLFAFMRRYFTTMFMHRFGKERANFALETVRTGFYLEAIKGVAKTLGSFGKYIPLMPASEKRAMMKVSADVAQIMIISAIASLLFGYDDDDEDRFAKLKAKSGALGTEDFNLMGWLSNHTLTLLLKTQSENDSFIPLPGVGLNNYLNLTNTTSVAFGPTITAYAKILTDLSMHAAPGEDDDLYYKRDTGPYPWQKEGEAKVWNHLGSMLGFSGSQVDPVKGLQSFEVYSKQ